MKERLKYYVGIYLLFVLVFALQKPLFMFYYRELFRAADWTDWFRVAFHGLLLDCSLAGYLTIVPGLLLAATIWSHNRGWRKAAKIYFAMVSLLLSGVLIIDLALYQYWGFRLDTTPFFYFFSSPKDAMASISLWTVAGGVAAILTVGWLYYALFYFCILRSPRLEKRALPPNRPLFTLIFVLLIGLLIIPIRGGFSVSTMNVGKVYFSENIHLNHAATNPLFSLLASSEKQADFKDQYRYMDDARARRLVADLLDPEVLKQQKQAPDEQLLNIRRPNILFVVMESFSSKLMHSLGGLPNVAVNLDRLSAEGVFFRNFYATSFRTDRGLISILSGFPSQPTTSMMKYPKISQHLPSIARELRKAGYTTGYFYGGDADFTNMRSYLMASGFQSIVSDEDFPLGQRLSKWGVHDHLVFEKLLSVLRTERPQRPWFRVLQTSSSHEPYDVPYHRLADKALNAFAYTDSCIGRFVAEIKRLPLWRNTLLVLVPDHLGCYPEHIDNLSVERYQIPLIFLGGALQGPKTIDTYGSQTDIAATLLAQLDITHRAFTYSKDIFNVRAPHFAFFTFPDAFGWADAQNRLVFDNESKKIVVYQGKQKAKQLERGQAYLQQIYDTIDAYLKRHRKENKN